LVGVHLCFVTVLLPLRFILFILLLVLPDGGGWLSVQTLEPLRDRFSISTLFFYSMWYIPLVALFVIRYVVGGFEGHFFTILQQQDPDLCTTLMECTPEKVHELLWRQLKRGLRTLTLALVMFLLWKLPLVAALILPPYMIFSLNNLSRFYKYLMTCTFFGALHFLQGHLLITGRFVVVSFWVYRNFRRYFHSAGVKGDLLGLVLCCVCSLDVLEPVVLVLINVIVVSHALALELLDPYFCRARLSEREMSQLRADHKWILLGYGLPLTFLLTIPLVGLLAWGYAQGSAALLLTKMKCIRININSKSKRSDKG